MDVKDTKEIRWQVDRKPLRVPGQLVPKVHKANTEEAHDQEKDDPTTPKQW